MGGGEMAGGNFFLEKGKKSVGMCSFRAISTSIGGWVSSRRKNDLDEKNGSCICNTATAEILNSNQVTRTMYVYRYYTYRCNIYVFE